MRRYYDLVFIKNKKLIEKIIEKKGYNALLAPVKIKSMTYKIDYEENKEYLKICEFYDYKNARKIMEKGNCDIWLNPTKIFFNHALDYVIIKIAAENNVALAFLLSDFMKIKNNKKTTLAYINKTAKIIQLANKFNAKVIVGSGATRFNQVRYGRDLAAYYYFFVPNLKESLKAISDNYEFLIKKLELRKERMAPGIYEEG